MMAWTQHMFDWHTIDRYVRWVMTDKNIPHFIIHFNPSHLFYKPNNNMIIYSIFSLTWYPINCP